MIRHAAVCVLAVASAFAVPVAASTATVSYRGTLTYVGGEQADRFHVGDPITVSYVVDTAAPDANALPSEGVFFGGLVSLQYSLPASGLSVTTGSGTVQSFDNVGDSDQAFFYSFSAAAGPGWTGGALTNAEVDFIGEHTGTDGQPDMLSSDSIPTAPLVAVQSFVSFQTAAGRTYLNFQVATEPTVAELVQDGMLGIDSLVAASRLKAGVGNALKAKLNALLLASSLGDTAGACSALADFRNQVNALVRSRQLQASDAAALIALAGALRTALGGC